MVTFCGIKANCSKGLGPEEADEITTIFLETTVICFIYEVDS